MINQKTFILEWKNSTKLHLFKSDLFRNHYFHIFYIKISLFLVHLESLLCYKVDSQCKYTWLSTIPVIFNFIELLQKHHSSFLNGKQLKALILNTELLCVGLYYELALCLDIVIWFLLLNSRNKFFIEFLEQFSLSFN